MTLLTPRNTAGGAFSPTETTNWFLTFLAASSVGLASGFRVVQTRRSSIDIPRLLTDVAANWTAEGTEITASDPSADVLTAIPRKIAALTFVSNELASDSNPDVTDMLGESMARSMALKLDKGFFEGSGVAPEIRGLRNTSGIQVLDMAANGAAFTNLDPIADALGLLREQNAEGKAIVMHPRVWRGLTKLKEGTVKPVLMPDLAEGPKPAVYGTPVFLTPQLSTNETQGTATAASSVYVYDSAQVVAVVREDFELETDGSAAFTSDRTAVRARLRVDLAVPYPAAVVRIRGVL